MFRITLISQTPEEVVLKVEGQISKEDVPVLEEEGACWLGKTDSLVMDLTGVRFIDRVGIALLKCWAGEGLLLRSESAFNRALLAAHGLDTMSQKGR